MKKRVISILCMMAVTAALLCGCGSSGAQSASASGVSLNIFIWTEYVPDSVIQKFEEETGVKVNVTTYSSNEDMLAKVKAEAAGTYDIVQPSDYAIEQMASQGMLMELDHEKLENLSNISEVYLDPSYDPGNVYSVPFQGGVAAMAINTAEVDQEIDAYDDLFDPAFSGSLVVLDDYRAVIGMVARSMGYSMNETEPAVLAEIQDKLLTLKDNVKLYDSDSPKSALISGDCTAGYMWGAEVALAMEENPDIQVVYPSEGAYLFMDNWAIPTGCKHYDEAMQFINFMLEEETAKMVSEEFPYLCPNAAAVEAMGESYSSNAAKNPPLEVIQAGEYVSNLDVETLAIYDEMWTKLKQ